MRFAAVLLFWLATTAALVVAIPAAWAQLNVVDEDGYAAMAQKAARDPALQSAVAGELTTRALALINAHGGGRYSVDSPQVHDTATAFTAGPSFPALFGQANRAAHSWLFSEPRSGGSGDTWVLDVAPMLKDNSFRQILSDYNVTVPATLTIPVTVSGPLRQGQFHRLATRGPWVTIGAIALSAVCALVTLVAARRRGKALSSLGVAALLVGGAGWAAIEVGGRYLNDALNTTTGDIRRIADAMVGQAEGSLHLWLNVTLLAGVALVVVGVLVAVLGSVFNRAQRSPT